MTLEIVDIEKKRQQLRNWILSNFDTFRQEYSKLNEEERNFLALPALLTEPSQIELFWVSEPVEYQIFILFHDPERQDKEIVLNGPFNHIELVKNIIQIMEEPRWKKKATYDRESFTFSDPDIGDRENKYSDAFVNVFDYFIQSIQNLALIPIPKGLIFSFPIRERDFCALYFGNIAEVKPSGFACLNEIEYLKQNSAKIKNGTIYGGPASSDLRSKGDQITIFGAYYYPGVRIGDNVELNFQEKLQGPNILEYPKYEYEFTFAKEKGYYDRYGLVLVETKTESEAIKKLNTIFGVSLIFGIDAYSVRTSEILKTDIPSDYIPSGKPLGSYEWRFSASGRDNPRNFRGLRKTKITFNQIEEIIKISDIVWQNNNLDDSLLFLLEGYTHLKNSEYSQAFIFCWLIIEKFISETFEQFLVSKKVDKHRARKFKSPEKWSNSNKIEVLNLNGILNDEEYTFLSEFNTKRNNLVHIGKLISDLDATKVFDFSFNIIKSNIEILMNPNSRIA